MPEKEEPEKESEYCFVAMTMLGARAIVDEPWELAARIDDGTEAGKKRTWFMKVESLAFANPETLKEYGFHERHPSGVKFRAGQFGRTAEALDPKAVMRDFADFAFGKVLVVQRQSYCFQQLELLAASQGYIRTWDEAWYEVYAELPLYSSAETVVAALAEAWKP